MKRVIVESPFKGDRDLHCRYACALMRFCFARREAPFLSHLLYPQCLDDDHPAERLLGIEAGLCWGECAAKTVVGIDLGLSDGMRLGILRARDEGREVEYVSLQAWRVVAPGLLESQLFWLRRPGEAMTVQVVDHENDHPLASVP